MGGDRSDYNNPAAYPTATVSNTMPELQTPHPIILPGAAPGKLAIGTDGVMGFVAEAMTSGVVTVPGDEAPVPIEKPTETLLLLLWLDLVDFEVVETATRICVTTTDPTGLMSG